MAEVIVWIVLVGMLLVSIVIIGFTNHFECGGTLGGFGESASARLDEACVGRRAWLYAIPLVVFVTVLVTRLLWWRRSGTSR